jgi:hypothetical protein
VPMIARRDEDAAGGIGVTDWRSLACHLR